MHVVRRSARAGAAARLAVLAGAFLPSLALAEYGLNFQTPVTPIAHKIFDLHMLILWICVAIFVLVFGFMFYSIARHRKSLGAKPASFHDNVKLEVLWTIIPFLILVGMAIPSTATLIEMEDTSRSDMTVKITGYQWKWKYDYPDHDVSFFSNLSTPATRSRTGPTRASTTSSRSITRWCCRSARKSVSCSPRTTSSTPGGCRHSA